MFPKYFFALCALVFFAAVADARIVPQADINSLDLENVQLEASDSKVQEEVFDESIEARNPLLQVAINIIKAAFKWAATHCIKEAAENCKQYWNHPGQLVSCAGNFFKANKGRCALG
ncbi:uncharacterized protein LOC107982150 [Nasonia vitripennis]|uniref:Uncharacterized protein n=1 Tax=Nasonia vitripennis TaxID=7425 RepID=K7JKR2_NASVI|nr:uncharacterized protein LOC107982148 [Nasonia vitripennis]XP_016845151.1 uncharacterized protein LOC107982150 [Nasonia vitripennis]